jgi:hypothetical protein
MFAEPLEVTRYRIDPRELQESKTYTSTPPNLTYKVSTVANHMEVGDAFKIKYSGSLSLEAVQFDFHNLIGVYVRKKLPIAKEQMQAIRSKRPVARLEKEYVKALAKAAREAPGNASAFEGMQGW